MGSPIRDPDQQRPTSDPHGPRTPLKERPADAGGQPDQIRPNLSPKSRLLSARPPGRIALPEAGASRRILARHEAVEYASKRSHTELLASEPSGSASSKWLFPRP